MIFVLGRALRDEASLSVPSVSPRGRRQPTTGPAVPVVQASGALLAVQAGGREATGPGELGKGCSGTRGSAAPWALQGWQALVGGPGDLGLCRAAQPLRESAQEARKLWGCRQGLTHSRASLCGSTDGLSPPAPTPGGTSEERSQCHREAPMDAVSCCGGTLHASTDQSLVNEPGPAQQLQRPAHIVSSNSLLFFVRRL